MVSFCHLASQIREFASKNITVADLSLDDTRTYLCFRLAQWQKGLPLELHFAGSGDDFDPNFQDRGTYRLRLLLFLRANQMRMLINRNIIPTSSKPLTSCVSIMECIEAARSNIHVLKRLNETTDIYRSQQMCFNHFLHAAFAVLLMSVTYDPASFLRTCGRDINMALDILRTLSINSSISRRLWESVKVFKNFESRLRQPSRNETVDRPPRTPVGYQNVIEPNLPTQPGFSEDANQQQSHPVQDPMVPSYRNHSLPLPESQSIPNPPPTSSPTTTAQSDRRHLFNTAMSYDVLPENARSNTTHISSHNQNHNPNHSHSTTADPTITDDNFPPPWDHLSNFNLDFLGFNNSNNNDPSDPSNPYIPMNPLDFSALGDLPTFEDYGGDMFTF